MARKNKKDDNKKKSPKDTELTRLDKTAKNILSILDSSYTDKQILSSKDQKFRSILNRELEISKGVSNGSIIDFVSSIRVDNQNTMKNGLGQNNTPDANSLFTQNINDIFGYFQELYRNRFIEIDDLKFIAKFIPALGEAVKTVLDAIVSSDNIASTVNRQINLPASLSEEDKLAIINEIERCEKDLKLLKKLKNTVYKKTLITGSHYVYNVSYNKIFEEYDVIKKRENKNVEIKPGNQFNSNPKQRGKKVTESYVLGDIDISSAMESVKSILVESKSIETNKKITENEANKIIKECYNDMPIITCDNSLIYEPAIEHVSELMNSSYAMEAFMTNKVNKNMKYNDIFDDGKINLSTPDGTKGIHDIKPDKFDIGGTYIKYIDSKNIIPITVFDEKIGYYIIYAKPKKNKNSAGEVTGINTIGNTLFSAVDVGEKKKHDAVERIVDSISEGILNSFNSKFITDNSEYKKLIADCIVANGLTNKDYNIQFVPASDIIEFTINENEQGFGESILTDSLFPAKLLLSMVVCRMLNYINKTGNKTIAHIHKGPVNAYTSNQINRVIRDIQEQQITFNDLLSPNLVFNKFNRDGNLAIPTAKNGDRLVEFETQEGQNIDMSPEYEKTLENMAILGTGVPSVIMEYVGSADFAKQLVSANIKFAGRVATLQSDLEEATTELYKRIIQNSNLSDELKVLCSESLSITLPRPRVLTNSNNNDYVQSIVQTSETIADVALGRDSIQNTEANPNGVRIKEELMYAITKDSAPFVDWGDIDEKIKSITLKIATEKNESKKDETSGF